MHVTTLTACVSSAVNSRTKKAMVLIVMDLAWLVIRSGIPDSPETSDSSPIFKGSSTTKNPTLTMTKLVCSRLVLLVIGGLLFLELVLMEMYCTCRLVE